MCRLRASFFLTALETLLQLAMQAAEIDTTAPNIQPLPSLSEAIASKRDLWREAAMRQTNGASYEFFESLLPQPRYVHADFRYYPIVLSAPNSQVKARLISDGSGLN